jgi:chorismate mutase
MRDQITDNDVKLIAAINTRLQLVARLREYKEARGVDFVDHTREAWMHQFVQAVNKGPLSAEGLREIYDDVLGLTKRETERRDAAG